MDGHRTHVLAAAKIQTAPLPVSDPWNLIDELVDRLGIKTLIWSGDRLIAKLPINAQTGHVKCYFKCPVIRLTGTWHLSPDRELLNEVFPVSLSRLLV